MVLWTKQLRDLTEVIKMSDTLSIQTLFGTFNQDELKAIRGAIDEVVVCMHKLQAEKELVKDIYDVTYDKFKIPKKILRKMAKVQYKQSFQEEVAEQKEFEALFECITEVK